MVVVTLLAALLAVWNTMFRGSEGSVFESSRHFRALGFFVGIAGSALIAGVVSGALMKLVGRSFSASFQRVYVVTLVCLVILTTWGQGLLEEAVAKYRKETESGYERPQFKAPVFKPSQNSKLAFLGLQPQSSDGKLDPMLLRKTGLALYNDLTDVNDLYQQTGKRLKIRLMDANAMSQPGNVAEAVKKLGIAAAAAAEGRDKTKKLLASAASRADADDIPEAQKPLLKAALQKVVDHSAPLIVAVWDREIQGVTIFNSLAQILDTKSWQPSDAGFLFRDGQDQADYEAKLQELQRCFAGGQSERNNAFESLRLAVILPGEK